MRLFGEWKVWAPSPWSAGYVAWGMAVGPPTCHALVGRAGLSRVFPPCRLGHFWFVLCRHRDAALWFSSDLSSRCLKSLRGLVLLCHASQSGGPRSGPEPWPHCYQDSPCALTGCPRLSDHLYAKGAQIGVWVPRLLSHPPAQ